MATTYAWLTSGLIWKKFDGLPAAIPLALKEAVVARLLAAVYGLVVRYRRAGPVERRQLTWFVYAALLAVAVLAVNALGLIPWQPVAIVLGAAVE